MTPEWVYTRGQGWTARFPDGTVLEVVINYYSGSRQIRGFEYTVGTDAEGVLIESSMNYQSVTDAQQAALKAATWLE